MLQGIYGTAWESAEKLKAYIHFEEEAKRRDQRRIGHDLDLFSIQDEASGGLVFWHPKGAILFIRDFSPISVIECPLMCYCQTAAALPPFDAAVRRGHRAVEHRDGPGVQAAYVGQTTAVRCGHYSVERHHESNVHDSSSSPATGIYFQSVTSRQRRL
ncbi:threonine--tRNA ligase [Striga asiatica]|uniref:Threonine--tRNA ligase n=1 Tax=Striga asiatica TaxID=4170 RepID=A0A5A7RCA1_STRAF|nr:threonine--tRNA ligase [Striga asiatica]